jgi:hypothetical protein
MTAKPVRRFTFDGNTYEMLARPLYPEVAWVERQAGIGIEDMVSVEQTRSLMLLSLRRAGVLLTWEDFEQLSPADFVEVKTPVDPLVEEPADPTAADAEVGSVESPASEPEASTEPSTSSPTSTGSTSSATFI